MFAVAGFTRIQSSMTTEFLRIQLLESDAIWIPHFGGLLSQESSCEADGCADSSGRGVAVRQV
jgi:hypothetical protein